MHIVNAMFSRNLGGIEQSFVDYSAGLLHNGHTVTSCIYPNAAVNKLLQEKCNNINHTIFPIKNFSQWDVFATNRFRKLLKTANPDAIITHGVRAAMLARRASNGKIPVIATAHNYNIKRLIGMDGIFSITGDLQNKIINAGHPEDNIYHIPNMIFLPETKPRSPRSFHSTPVIGTLGRFVPKKGFDIFIQALHMLKERGLEFQAIIAGKGEEEHNLKGLVRALELEDNVEFPGWISDKDAFFRSMDIFCLPSSHEPFGIVLLEALSYGLPIVTTTTEGPKEIVTHNNDALFVSKNNPKEMANALESLLTSPVFATCLALEGVHTVEKYSHKKITKRIENALEDVINRRLENIQPDIAPDEINLNENDENHIHPAT